MSVVLVAVARTNLDPDFVSTKKLPSAAKTCATGVMMGVVGDEEVLWPSKRLRMRVSFCSVVC